MRSLFERKSFLLAALGLLALGAAALSVYATWNGPIGFSDTAAYLASGRNWARGIGLGVFQPSGDFEPLTVHPPLYSLYFGLLQFLGVDLINGGRWLNVIAAGLAALAMGLLFLRHSRRSWLGLLAAAVFIVFPSVIDVFAALMTDGVFIALWLWGMLALFAYLENPQKKSLAAAVLLFGALPLLRYIGLAFLITGTLLVLFWSSGERRQRSMQAIGFGAGALAPSLLWQLISYLTLEQRVAGRAISLGEIDYSDAINELLLRTAQILQTWNPFAVGSVVSNPWPILFTVASVASLAAWLVRRLGAEQGAASSSVRDARLFWAFALSAVIFLASISAAFLFTRPTPDVIERTLLPLLVCILVCSFAALPFLDRWRPAAGSGAALALGLALLLGLARPAYEFIAPLHRGQVGYFTNPWRSSALIEQVKSLPADRAIIASQPGIILYWADRPAYDMLRDLRAGFLDSGQSYGSHPELDTLQRYFQEGAALVLFEQFPTGLLQHYGDTLTRGLNPLGQFPEGAIYAYPER